jgi:hypothetical protein
MEFNSRYSDGFPSGEEGEVYEGEVGVDNIIETGLAQDRGSQLLHKRMCIGGKIETTKKGKAALELEAGVVPAQRKHYQKVINELEALILEREHKAATTENITEEGDALRVETEELLVQREDCGKLEDQLKFLTQTRKDITKESYALLSEVQDVVDNKVTLSKDKDVLKLEAINIRALHKATVLLEKKLKVVKVEYDSIIKEAYTFESRHQCPELNIKAIRKAVEDLQLVAKEIRSKIKDCASLEQELNTVKQNCERIKKDRNVFILRVQKIAKSIEIMRRKRDDLNLEKENLRTKIKDVALVENQIDATRLLCEDIEKERDIYKLKSQKAARGRGVIMKDIDALKSEKEKLLAQCKKNALLEKQLKTANQDCDNMKNERNAFILKVKSIAADRKAMRKEIIALRLEEENLKQLGCEESN